MSTVVASNVFGCPKTDHGHFNGDKKTVLLARRFEESIAMSWVFKILDYDTISIGGICMFLDTSMYLCCQIYLYEFRYNHSTFVDLLDCCRDKEKGLVT